MMVLQARDQESEEGRAVRLALDRANHAMVKRFVCILSRPRKTMSKLNNLVFLQTHLFANTHTHISCLR